MVAKGLWDPWRADPGQHRLDKSLPDYMQGCKDGDPAPRPQLAVPKLTRTPGSKPATGNLIVLVFFFLLGVGEYTPSDPDRRH